MSKHTPGPWTCEDQSEVIARVPTPGHAGRMDTLTICRTMDVEIYYDDRGGSTEANARLLCAAPDLLAACQQSLQELEVFFHGYHIDADKNPTVILLRAAIARATSE